MANKENERTSDSSESDENKDYDPRLDFFSDQFDPLLALRTPGLKVPDINAKRYDNLAQYDALTRKEKLQEQNALKKKPVPADSSTVERRFLPHQMPIKSNVVYKERNVLTRMAAMTGPLALLRKCKDERLKIKETIILQIENSEETKNPLPDSGLIYELQNFLCKSKGVSITSKFSCEICEQSYGCINCLKSHYQTLHINNSVTKYKCKFSNHVSKSFVCPVCDLTFSNRNDRMDHYTRRCIACEICGSCFERQSHFTGHYKTSYNKGDYQRTYECELCKTLYQYPVSLSKHYQTFHKMVLCYICKLRFISSAELQKHEEIHRQKLNVLPFLCRKCNKAFPKISDIAVHIRQDHKKDCADCPHDVVQTLVARGAGNGGQMPVQKKLKETIILQIENSEEKKDPLSDLIYELQNFLCKNKDASITSKYSCDICEESYGCINCLKSHYQTLHITNSVTKYKCEFSNHVSKSLVCPVCDLTFSNRNDRMDHYITHFVACEICGLDFDRQSHLTGHYKIYHNKDDYQPTYECELCKTCPVSLSKHYQAFHKMVLCYICKLRFISSAELQKHEEIHRRKLNVLPFACSKCDKAFPKISDIVVHIRQDHKKNCANCPHDVAQTLDAGGADNV